jgi:two-component SAPR family response regulator
MIKVVLIDDEEPALLEMEYLLSPYEDISIIGKFTNTIIALEKVIELKPDVVFLDINMPQLDGMDIARKFIESKVQLDIVFVTAYEQYALEAFNVQALDYLLKPISKDRLAQTISRLLRNRKQEAKELKKKFVINSMGNFFVGWEGEPPIKWRTEKAKEVFAFLLHNRGLEISKDRIIDQLWEGHEIDKAIHQLHNSIYYIRKRLEDYGVTQNEINISKGYCLYLGDVIYDCEIIESCIAAGNSTLTIDDLEKQLLLFKGGYFEFEDWCWAEYDREMLARYEINLLVQLSKKYIEAKLYNKAEVILKKAFLKNSFEEEIAHLLMELYEKSGEKVKARKHFEQYQRFLKDELGVVLTESIKKIK